MKKNKYQISSEGKKTDKKSKEYTTKELVELGHKRNTIPLAPPLFDKQLYNK